jgi:hypothetical protein
MNYIEFSYRYYLFGGKGKENVVDFAAILSGKEKILQ